MANVVFILGAGASAQDGCPCMGDFFEKSRSLWQDGLLDEHSAAYELIARAQDALGQVQSRVIASTDNLEWVLNAVEMLQTVGMRLPGISEPLRQVRESLVDLIGAVLERTQHFGRLSPTSRQPAGPPAYNSLVSFAQQLMESEQYSRVSFITFNYDLGLDIAIGSHGHGVDYCLPHEFCSPDTSHCWQLYKMHGSLNWFEGIGVREQPILKCVDAGSIREASSAIGSHPSRVMVSRALRHLGHTEGAVIIPPTESKGSLRRKVQPIWASAARDLASADTIVVCGYSLPPTDYWFRLLLAASSVDGATLRRFYVFDKNPSIEQHYGQLLAGEAKEGYRFHPLSFRDAIDYLRTHFTRHGHLE